MCTVPLICAWFVANSASRSAKLNSIFLPCSSKASPGSVSDRPWVERCSKRTLCSASNRVMERDTKLTGAPCSRATADSEPNSATRANKATSSKFIGCLVRSKSIWLCKKCKTIVQCSRFPKDGYLPTVEPSPASLCRELKELTMRAIVNTIATSHTISAQPSFQDYLRISQTARNAAQRARREAVPA
jgi:hypothetical protein